MAFYAQYDPTVTPLSPVIGWYDVQDADNPNGVVYGVMPPTAQLLAVTQDQWEARVTNPSAWAVEGGSLVAAAPVANTLSPYASLIAGGITITSIAYSALNGVYSIDPAAQVNITTEASFVATFQEFTTGGSTNFPWQMMNGTFIEFPTTAEFMAFAKAVGQLIGAAKLAAAQGNAMPSAAATIP